MQCSDSLVQMYVDGELGAAERLIVEAHLSGCRACRAAVTAYKALMWDMAHPAVVETPPELAALSDRLMEAWDEHQAPTKESAEGSLIGASLGWTRVVPVVSVSVAAAERVGRTAPQAVAGALTRLARRLLKGGGRR